MIKLYKYYIFSVVLIFILFAIFNAALLKHPKTALTDWLDYPLMVYIQKENINHLAAFNFEQFGSISMYYPSPDGKYFTDLLLPQSILGLFIFPFAQNYIATHNIVFFIMGLLNIISLHYFWAKIFKDKKIVSILSALFMFSPYSFGMQYHYQMLLYSFFFFSLGKLISAKNKKEYLIAGLFSGLQFISSVYLGIFSLTVSGIFFLWQLLQKKRFLHITTNGIIFLLGFLVLAGFFAFQYQATQKEHQIQRPADAYVNNAMQITDIFFNPLPSFWTKHFYYKINVNNHRLGNETFSQGFVLLALIILGIYTQTKINLNKNDKFIFGFIVVVLIWGIIAVIGPRLTINGKYLATPLPYIFPLKLTPFFTPIRVVARWFFVVQIGLFYFVGRSLDYILKKYSFQRAAVLIGFLSILYFLEIVPIEQRNTNNTYQTTAYEQIIKQCSSNQVVLEYPFTPQLPKTPTEETLNYWVKIILNQMHYDCQLVNGYSGFQPKHIDEYILKFTLAIENSDFETIQNLIKNKNVTFIKFNKTAMLNKTIQIIEKLFTTSNFTVLVNNSEYLVVMIK